MNTTTAESLIQWLFAQYGIPTRSQSLRIENGSAEINTTAMSCDTPDLKATTDARLSQWYRGELPLSIVNPTMPPTPPTR